MAGLGQTISKLGTFFVYTLALSMPIFEKKSHPIRPVEDLKLCLDFLCNVRITGTGTGSTGTMVELTLPTGN